MNWEISKEIEYTIIDTCATCVASEPRAMQLFCRRFQTVVYDNRKCNFYYKRRGGY